MGTVSASRVKGLLSRRSKDSIARPRVPLVTHCLTRSARSVGGNIAWDA